MWTWRWTTRARRWASSISPFTPSTPPPAPLRTPPAPHPHIRSTPSTPTHPPHPHPPSTPTHTHSLHPHTRPAPTTPALLTHSRARPRHRSGGDSSSTEQWPPPSSPHRSWLEVAPNNYTFLLHYSTTMRYYCTTQLLSLRRGSWLEVVSYLYEGAAPPTWRRGAPLPSPERLAFWLVERLVRPHDPCPNPPAR